MFLSKEKYSKQYEYLASNGQRDSHLKSSTLKPDLIDVIADIANNHQYPHHDLHCHHRNLLGLLWLPLPLPFPSIILIISVILVLILTLAILFLLIIAITITMVITVALTMTVLIVTTHDAASTTNCWEGKSK